MLVGIDSRNCAPPICQIRDGITAHEIGAPIARVFAQPGSLAAWLVDDWRGSYTPVSSTGQCNTSRSLSAGVSKPKVFRGR
jgi:hypothetical protein